MIALLKQWYTGKRDTLQDFALRVYESLWFRPICWVAGLSALAMVLILVEWFYIDAAYWEEWFVLWRSQADGAKTMLGAIAGATLTVVSLAFSLMMVVVIQTANAYSPRLLSQFIADRHNHHVLGLLMGSFAYALLTLRSIRTEPDFVPHIAVNMALLLSMASIIALISFIQHVAESIQVASIITLIETQTSEVLSHESERAIGCPFRGEFSLSAAWPVKVKRSGYVRVIERDVMKQLLEFEEVVVEWHREVGDHVLEGSPLATIWHCDRLDGGQIEELETLLQGAITVGNQRAWFHDVRYGFQQLTDIALKALSPGINDPTTAVMALHALTKLVRDVLHKEMHHARRADEHGELRLIYPDRWLERLLVESFGQIMHYGHTDFMVMETLLKSLGQLAASTRDTALFETMRACIEGLTDFTTLDNWSRPQRDRISTTLRELETRLAVTAHHHTRQDEATSKVA